MVIKVENENYKNKRDVFNVINYVINPDREDLMGRGLIGFPDNQSIENIQNAVWKNKLYHKKTTGRNIRHMIISLSDEEMQYFSVEDLRDLGYYVGTEIYNGFMTVFGIHYPNGGNLHIHLVLDTVDFFTGLKFQESPQQLKKHSEMIKKFLGSLLPNGFYYNENFNINNGETEYVLQNSIDLEDLL